MSSPSPTPLTGDRVVGTVNSAQKYGKTMQAVLDVREQKEVGYSTICKQTTSEGYGSAPPKYTSKQHKQISICLAHIYADDNKGDLGIIAATIRALTDAAKQLAIKEIEITAISMLGKRAVMKSNAHRFLKHMVKDIVPSFVGQHYREERTIRRNVEKIFIIPTRMVISFTAVCLYVASGRRWISILPKDAQSIVRSDLVVIKGGSLIYCDKSIRNHFFLIRILIPIMLACALRRPIVIFGQSIGPFETTASQWLASFLLRKVDCIWVREAYSRDELRALGIAPQKLMIVPDIALYNLHLSTAGRSSSLESQCVLGVTAKHLSFNQEEQLDYEEKIAGLLSDFLGEYPQYKIWFFPQVVGPESHQDDRIVQHNIVRLMPSEYKDRMVVIDDDLTPDELLGLYQQLTVMFASRLHSAIFAMSSGVPCIVLEYQQKKALGTLSMLGLGAQVVNWRESRENIFAHLKRTVPDISRISAGIGERSPNTIAAIQDSARMALSFCADAQK